MNTGASRRKYFRHIALVLFAGAVVYLAGNASVGLWDRDEPRNAQAARQMWQTGDWTVPRFLDEVRTAKPVFIYWCQASAMAVFGDNAFAARLPSVVAMLLTLALLASALPREVGRRRGRWAIFILASSGLSLAAAKMSLTDSVLLLFVTIAQCGLYQIIRRRDSWRTWIAMSIAIGLAGLTKGPVVIGVMGMTIIVLWALRLLKPRHPEPYTAKELDSSSRQDPSPSTAQDDTMLVASGSRWVRVIVSVAIVAAICGPWLILIHRREPGFLPTIIGHDVIERMKTGLEGHGAPPGFYLLTIWLTYFPWSFFLPVAIVYAWKRRADLLMRFCFAAVVGPWIMFELVRTKLPHYLLPVFPPLALLTARALMYEAHRARGRPRDRVLMAVVVIWCAMLAAASLAPLALTLWLRMGGTVTLFASLLAGAIGIETAHHTYRSFRARRQTVAAAVMGIGMLLLVGVLYGGWIGRVPQIRVSQRVAAVLHREGATDPGQSIMMGYKEPSLAFYQGGTIREESDNAYLSRTDPLLWPRWVVISGDLWDRQPTGVRDRLEVIERINGLWYANQLKQVSVIVARKK